MNDTKKAESNPAKIKKGNKWNQLGIPWVLNSKNIAEHERNIRSFQLSSDFSSESVTWVERIEKLKEMDTKTSADVLEIWLDEILLPKLPPKPKYFLGQDAFEALLIARNTLIAAEDRLCQIAMGNNWISASEYYEYALDLFLKKRYQESILKSQIVLQHLSRKINCNDIDHDNIPIPFDECPLEPEDKDRVDDDDGCPE